MQATNIVIALIITVKSSCAFAVIKKKKKKISERRTIIGLRWGLKIAENSWKELAKPIGNSNEGISKEVEKPGGQICLPPPKNDHNKESTFCFYQLACI